MSPKGRLRLRNVPHGRLITRAVPEEIENSGSAIELDGVKHRAELEEEYGQASPSMMRSRRVAPRTFFESPSYADLVAVLDTHGVFRTSGIRRRCASGHGDRQRAVSLHQGTDRPSGRNRRRPAAGGLLV